MDDVAAAAGVSRALVSLVMSDSPKVSAGSRQRVRAAAQALGYRPHLMARTLASRRTMLIGVLLDDLHNPFYAEIADGILAAADESKYRVLFTTRNPTAVSQRAAFDTLLELRGDGAVLVSPRLAVRAVEQAAATTPLVAVSEPLLSNRVDTVTNDEGLGARLVVDHLVALGHKDIVHIDGGKGAGAKARRRSFLEAMKAHGIEDYARVVEGGFSEEAGYTAARTILDSRARPTAIFAGNDAAAAGVLDLLYERNVSVPGEISVCGYDNVALAHMGLLSLTTVDQPRFAMGHLAVTTLLERMENRSSRAAHHVIPPTLVVRRSTGPAVKRRRVPKPVR